LGQRQVRFAAGDGQDLQDARELARSVIGLDDLAPGRIGEKAERAPLLDEILGERGCHGDAVFLGRWRQVGRRREDVAVLGAGRRALDQRGKRQIQEDPDVGQRVQLELLDQQPVFAGGAAPVNPVEAVAGLVVSNTGGVCGDEVCAAAHRLAARQRAQRCHEAVDRNGRRVDDDARLRRDVARKLEQTERVTADDGHRPERVFAALTADRVRLPAVLAARQDGGYDITGVVVG